MGIFTATILTLLGTAVAGPVARQATAQYCDEMTGLCYSEYSDAQLGITYRIASPEGAEGAYDVALQIVGTSAVGWAGIAWGGEMASNPLTIGWANGEEAVASSRWATGHSPPEMYDGATYTTLPGSGSNGTHWTVSVLCSGCTSWEGGSVDASGSARFAYGMAGDGPADPADVASQFGIHQAKGGWSHDMAASANADFAALVEAALGGGATVEEPAEVPEEPETPEETSEEEEPETPEEDSEEGGDEVVVPVIPMC